jgi:hypothetical protein
MTIFRAASCCCATLATSCQCHPHPRPTTHGTQRSGIPSNRKTVRFHRTIQPRGLPWQITFFRYIDLKSRKRLKKTICFQLFMCPRGGCCACTTGCCPHAAEDLRKAYRQITHTQTPAIQPSAPQRTLKPFISKARKRPFGHFFLMQTPGMTIPARIKPECRPGISGACCPVWHNGCSRESVRFLNSNFHEGTACSTRTLH